MPTSTGNVSFTYDGTGTRVKKSTPSSTSVYVDKMYECTNGVCAKYIFAGSTRLARNSNGIVHYYHPDHLGSTSIVTDAAGAVAEDITYYPFGTSRQDSGTVSLSHKFTGQEKDSETGLYNYNARLYDADFGRFLTPDSIVPDSTNPQSLNRYSYVLNNPLLYTDPSGHSFWNKAFGVAEIIGGFATIYYAPPELKFIGAISIGDGVDRLGGDSDVPPSSTVQIANSGGGSGSTSSSNSSSSSVPISNSGYNYVGPGAAAINTGLNGGSPSEIASAMLSSSGSGNYASGSFQGLSLGYGGSPGGGLSNSSGSAGGIALDFGGGYGSTKVPNGIHSAGNAGSGFYLGHNNGRIEIGAFSYQATGVIDGVKLGAGVNISIYNTSANNFFSGSSSYRTTTGGPGSYTTYYSSNGDVNGRALSVVGKGLGFGNEQGESVGIYAPFKS